MFHTKPTDEVFADLVQIVSEVLKVPAESVTAQARISDLAHVESIKLLRIAGKIERRFDIEIDNETVFRRGTVSDIANEIRLLREAAV